MAHDNSAQFPYNLPDLSPIDIKAKPAFHAFAFPQAPPPPPEAPSLTPITHANCEVKNCQICAMQEIIDKLIPGRTLELDPPDHWKHRGSLCHAVATGPKRDLTIGVSFIDPPYLHFCRHCKGNAEIEIYHQAITGYRFVSRAFYWCLNCYVEQELMLPASP